MRPTIPIGPWRIAVDLAATAAIQNQPGTPAFGCACMWCQNWSRACSSVLPDQLAEQLRRLRIDVSHPTDLYAFDEAPDGAHCRVVFHVAGKLLSGPNAWNEDLRLGKVRVYSELRPPPADIWLVVVPVRETFDARPHVDPAIELVQIDFRLFVPLIDASSSQAF